MELGKWEKTKLNYAVCGENGKMRLTNYPFLR